MIYYLSQHAGTPSGGMYCLGDDALLELLESPASTRDTCTEQGFVVSPPRWSGGSASGKVSGLCPFSAGHSELSITAPSPAGEAFPQQRELFLKVIRKHYLIAFLSGMPYLLPYL